jgi:hypothetical protein
MYLRVLYYIYRVGVAQLIKRLATAWTARGSNPVAGEFFRTSPDRPWSPPDLLCNGVPGLTLG